MAVAVLSIKLRCASWQQLATIYKRDLSRGTMFLRAANPPPIGTEIRVDLTLPSATVIVLTGAVDKHLEDPQRGAGVEIKLAPIPASSVWMIESALASESKVRAATVMTPAGGVPIVAGAGGAGGGLQPVQTGPLPTFPTSNQTGPIPTIPTITSANSTGPLVAMDSGQEVASAEHELIRALQSEAESLKKLNPFLVLGVGYETNDADVRAAFGDLTKRYHPDRFARYQSPDLRQVAAEIFILIRDAYRRLGDDTSRAQVLASLGRGAAPRAVPGPRPVPAHVPPPRMPTSRIATPPVGVQVPPPPPPRPSSRADTEVSPAPAPIPTPPLVAAIPPTPSPRTAPSRPTPPTGAPPPVHTDRRPVLVSPAPSLVDNSDPSALDALLDTGKFDEAIAAYKLLAKKHPADRGARAGIELCEGLRALTNRDRLEAAQRFEAALEIDPSNERAARELADMRRQATNERKGLLSRLMGKKE